ncbi:DNA 3'phosphatase [Pelomyxa schiedti]|nr:DNA 3'phosphatase [Pelomyxa schiedti]
MGGCRIKLVRQVAPDDGGGYRTTDGPGAEICWTVDADTPVMTLGRSQLAVPDKRVSRSQVTIEILNNQLVANWLGTNLSLIARGDNEVLYFERGTPIPLQSGDVLHLLPNLHIYKITITPLIENVRSTQNRPKCPYGSKCYRKNPQHLIDFSHDVDSEMDLGTDAAPTVSPQTVNSTHSSPPCSAKPLDVAVTLSPPSWTKFGTVLSLISPFSTPTTCPVLGCDMDDTLITTRSGHKFPQNKSDWKWLFPNVPSILREMHSRGIKIVIFSNQAGVAKNHTNESDIQDKIIDMARDLGFTLESMIATAEDFYRKPSPTMWHSFMQKSNTLPDMPKSIFVGDAAGRSANWKPGKKRDFSTSDRAFAHNVHITFKTPEEFFLNESVADFEWDTPDPNLFLSTSPRTSLIEGGELFPLSPGVVEVVVGVGCPASGKSSFFHKYFAPKGYVIVNRDTLKTQDKCLQAAREALKRCASVCIDNTNPSASSREPYVKLAQEFGVSVRCLLFTTPIELAKHLNIVREKATQGGTKRIPKIAYAVFHSRFERPSAEEGFFVVKVNWLPSFTTPEEKALFLERT